MYGGHHCMFCGDYMTTKGVCDSCSKDMERKDQELKVMLGFESKNLVTEPTLGNSLYEYFWDKAVEQAAKIADSKDASLAKEIRALRKHT